MFIQNTNFEIPFFEDNTKCKIYNDGGHYIATIITHSKDNCVRSQKEKDLFFEEKYIFATTELGITNKKQLLQYILSAYIEEYHITNTTVLELYIQQNIKRMKHNLFARKKRFRRKAHLNQWNNFVTITYDDKLHTPNSFKKKLRKCLSNLHSRRGWNYAGVFEKAPVTGRLHFHALMYIPDGEMLGTIQQVKDYSTKTHQMQTSNSNSFFAETFGRNDFQPITDDVLKHTNAVEYITKYLEKTNEKVIYSRGIPTELEMELNGTDIVTAVTDFFTTKYILFDDFLTQPRIPINFEYNQLSLFG